MMGWPDVASIAVIFQALVQESRSIFHSFYSQDVAVLLPAFKMISIISMPEKIKYMKKNSIYSSVNAVT